MRAQARWVGPVRKTGMLRRRARTERPAMCLVLVGDENSVEPRWIFARNGHTPEEFAAGEARVNQNAGPESWR